MGKRKERRLAAMSSASRRVKLDLFAEPSGEMGESSLQDRRNVNEDNHAGATSSPSSGLGSIQSSFQAVLVLRKLNELLHASTYLFGITLEEFRRKYCIIGIKEENPLLLLGQYSDDDLEEDVGKDSKNVDELYPSNGLSDQAEHITDEGDTQCLVEEGISEIKELERLNNVQNLEDKVIEEVDVSAEADHHCETESALDIVDQSVGHDPSGLKNFDKEYQGWKIVWDEQSNRYYYWNISTGETSWELPHALDFKTSLFGKNDSLSVTVERSKPSEEVGTSACLETKLVSYANISSNNEEGSELTTTVDSIDHSLQHTQLVYGDYSAAGFPFLVSSTTIPYGGSFQNTDGVLPGTFSSTEEILEQRHQLAPESNESLVMVDVQSIQLVEYGEKLLQRLKALERSGIDVALHDSILREIEIRQSDCNSLSSYGSALLPLWWHIDARFKHLELLISKEETSCLVTSEQIQEPEANEDYQIKHEKSLLNTAAKDHVSVDENMFTALAPDNNHPASDGSNQRIPIASDAPVIKDSNIYSPTELPAPSPDLLIQDDVDMDVEMEVDDTTSLDQIVGEIVPPPPDEEWIPPPPPPEFEPIPPPPPPPDELPPVPPPAPIETAATRLYQEQYNLGHGILSLNYYTNHISEPLQPPYFEPVVEESLVSEVGSDVHPVVPVVYYESPAGNVPGGTESGIESPVVFAGRGPPSYQATAAMADAARNVGLISGGNLVTNAVVPTGISLVSHVSKNSSVQENAVGTTVEGSEASAVNGKNVVDSSLAAGKIQSKVGRSKKRTIAVAPTLKSNKKVSSLVDKWKAVKEEMQEEEVDEPEDTFEYLERKKQKEIEEWRARQIASGEAQDNANFVPLGGDWRERVRRKKEAKARAAIADAKPEKTEDTSKKPDLDRLSKDLPPGWQVFWDSSTKKVYYGNAASSETSWTRPFGSSSIS